ncbi:hypothetical protein SEVIR_1G170300v4 [Setaria viridis]|uniref:Uncharacterized protein n=1 Tax=Setaria viridis TaxID=4556 RepID=A0A4U6W9V3_SETVI|nr:hypothetical protein SEVIR_1G170300v2 [Setaria viridis]TKW39312.1 hypothetical protein SEVIR_1G170300v2 [Setaria viridis]TKW39313.1 hypothetical protein SEVIR_1G170300v2 [Setaria viridis]
MALAPAFLGRRFLGPPRGSCGFVPSLDCGAPASSAIHFRSSARNPGPSLRSKHPHDAAADPSLRCRRAATSPYLRRRRAANRRLRPLSSGLDDNVRMRQQLSPIKDFYGDFPALHKLWRDFGGFGARDSKGAMRGGPPQRSCRVGVSPK